MGARDVHEGQIWNTDLGRDAFVIQQLVTKDLKLKYRRSVLGVAWSVLNPLLMMAVQAIVFTRFMVIHDAAIPNFPLYLIVGNTAWALMSDATTGAMQSIIMAAPLLKKVRISRWAFPVQKVLFATVNYAFSLVAVGLVMLVFRWPISPWALLVPLGVAYLMLFCVGLSLLLSALAVYFRDVIHLWGVFLSVWLYLTPLFYSVSILPERLQALMWCNPMYLYLTFLRQCLLWRTCPDPAVHVGCILCALVMLLVGRGVFRRLEDRFILYI